MDGRPGFTLDAANDVIRPLEFAGLTQPVTEPAPTCGRCRMEMVQIGPPPLRLERLDVEETEALRRTCEEIREWVGSAPIPAAIRYAVANAYRESGRPCETQPPRSGGS